MSVIGVVGESTASQAPSLPPEKKPKQEKPPTKAKKSASSSATDHRISALDQKWSERFNRLEALLLAKSLEPTFSLISGLPLFIHHQLTCLRIQNPSSSLLTDLSIRLPSTLAQTLVVLSSRRLASCLQTVLLKDCLLLSALAQTLLLQSNSRPVSLSRIFTDTSLHQGALVQTPLLVSTSRPASLTPTLTDQFPYLLRAPANQSLTDLSPTDLNVLASPALIHRLYTKLQGKTVFLVWSWKQRVTFLTPPS